MTYKKLRISPFIEVRDEHCFYFESENIGNMDLDLIALELKAPLPIRSHKWTKDDAEAHVNSTQFEINGHQYQHFTIWARSGSQVPILLHTRDHDTAQESTSFSEAPMR